MSTRGMVAGGVLGGVGLLALACASRSPPDEARRSTAERAGCDVAQVPSWSDDDLEFFLHGSMGTEILPERVLAAFRGAYPDLFPGEDLAAFGVIEIPGELPLGFSRREVAHLGGLPSYGLNCASCHVTEVRPADGAGRPVRVLGTTGHFDAEAFFGAITVAQLRTADATKMGEFLGHYLRASDPAGAEEGQRLLASQFAAQKDAVAAAIAADPSGNKGLRADELHVLASEDLELTRARLESGVDLARVSHTFLRLFHNMRASLHVPDELPETLPPASGPGRNDAFGLLSAILFQAPTEYAPVKYGVMWRAGTRPWVHWDGNTRSPLGRNVLAALGLGAPLLGRRGVLDLSLVERHTAITDAIEPPAYPWPIDHAAAAHGERTYAQRCAGCHDGAESDARLHDPSEIGTDPRRARGFDAAHAELFNVFFREVRIEGFSSPSEPPIRSTGRYWAADLAGVWARSPYLHNGSVRTLHDLLTPPRDRPKSFRRGSRDYDTARMGFTDDGTYVLDATQPGNGNGGHDYGTDLDPAARADLLEYLKTR